LENRGQVLAETLGVEYVKESVPDNQGQLENLIFFKTGPMSFQDREIPQQIQEDILRAATSCTWMGRWKLLVVTDKSKRAEVVKAWQEDLKNIGRLKDVDWIERWKVAPLFIVFCQHRDFQPFQWVPGTYAKIGEIHEIGSAVRSVELKALEYGIGLHGPIMGLLMPEVNRGVKSVLGVPEDWELVHFGIMGYPKDEVEVTFPKLADVSFANKWGTPWDAKKSIS
jgi:nitroreductase